MNTYEKIKGLSDTYRESVLYGILSRRENIPSFFWNFCEITESDEKNTIVYKVSPDYLCAGDDSSYFRTPLTPKIAQRLADLYGCLLPTKHMVDTIYRSAPIKLYPRPYAPKEGQAGRTSSDIYKLSNDRIQDQLSKLEDGFKLGTLVAGQKKDVVITNKLLSDPKKVAIYGWHEKVGEPIQPLSLIHENYYVDYSHGIRFCSKHCIVNGKEHNLEEVLKDDILGKILTGTEPLKITRYKLDK